MDTQVDKELLIRLRQEGAVRVCEKLGADAVVGTQYDNVQYFTDLRRFFVYGWEPNSIAIINREQGVKLLDPGAFVAPGPHWQNEGAALKAETGWDHFTIFNANLIGERYAGWTKGALKELGVTKGKVGIDRVSWLILEAFKSAMPEIEFVNAEEALLLERAVKNEEEKKLMRHAGWIASEGVKAGIEAVRPGVTEYEIYGAFMGRMYELGSEGDGFYPFLTTGPVTEGALYPTNRVLEEGDPAVLDMGPIYEGYNGDCMRTGFAGEPTEAFKELYRVNYEAMYAGIDTIKPGIHISEVDAAVRQDRPGLRLRRRPFRHRARHRPQLLRAARVHEGGRGRQPPRPRARARNVLHARAALLQDAGRQDLHSGRARGDGHGDGGRRRGVDERAVHGGMPGGDGQVARNRPERREDDDDSQERVSRPTPRSSFPPTR